MSLKLCICFACPACSRLRRRANKMGTTVEWVIQKYKNQNGRCKICKKEVLIEEAHIDHDHCCCPGRRSCGDCLRDLLCGSCNLMLGHAHDNARTLNMAVGESTADWDSIFGLPLPRL